MASYGTVYRRAVDGPGATTVYYGDEVGMWGGNDPDDRQPMIWKDLGPYDDKEVAVKQDLFDHYVRLIAIPTAISQRCKTGSRTLC